MNLLRTLLGIALLGFFDEAQLSKPRIDVEKPGHLPQTADILHAHDYEGPEDA